MRIIEIPPKPFPLIESIRAIGYSLSTALADLVDNCIAAQARDNPDICESGNRGAQGRHSG